MRNTLVVLLAVCVACGGSEEAADTSRTDSPAAQRSLYDRLGGRDAIAMVVDSAVARVSADARINKKFARSDGDRVKAMVVEQVCAATGGPCTYSGRSMKDAHRNMAVTNGEFDAFVEDIRLTLESLNVPEGERTELLTMLGGMRADIVEVQSNETGTALPRNFEPVKGMPAADTTKRGTP